MPPDTIMVVLNLLNPDYEAIYVLAEPWGGAPHWVTNDRSKHIYFYNGYWQFDDREQNPNDIKDYYHGSVFPTDDNST